MTNLQKELQALSDPAYIPYITKTIPTLNSEKILGVRVPVLRTFYRTFKKSEEASSFLNNLPHRYHEENLLHVMFLCDIRDFDKCMSEVERFLPYIDNWAVCDTLSPKAFNKHRGEVRAKITEWVHSSHTYTIRYGMKCLLGYFDDKDFDVDQLELVASVVSDEYYIKMMIAWYFATALTFQYEKTVPYIEKHSLPDWVHRKTIQKAVESFRISDERKEYLKSFR